MEMNRMVFELSKKEKKVLQEAFEILDEIDGLLFQVSPECSQVSGKYTIPGRDDVVNCDPIDRHDIQVVVDVLYTLQCSDELDVHWF